MIHETIKTNGVPVYIHTADVEDAARIQLIQLAESGICVGYVAAMPDVHYGAGATIGSVFASHTAVSPNAVGVDIGCGMAALKFDYWAPALSRAKLKEIHARIKLEIPTGFNMHAKPRRHALFEAPDASGWLKAHIDSTTTRQLGTLGGGNHFIELCVDEEDALWIVIHSGSRHIGKVVADYYNAEAKLQMAARGIKAPNPDLNHLLIDSDSGRAYLRDMIWCQSYAFANRAAMLAISHGVLNSVAGTEIGVSRTINVHHNYCTEEVHTYRDPVDGEVRTEAIWVTRKGAVRAHEGDISIIPGSMATGSYVTVGLDNAESWKSSSHGAGRRLSRNKAFSQISQEDFERSMAGIVAETVPELRDEAPAAYKDLESVMHNQRDLVKPLHHLRPILNVKGYEKRDPNRLGRLVNERKSVVFVAPRQSPKNIDFSRVEAYSDNGGKKGSAMLDVADLTMRVKGKMLGEERTFWVDDGAGTPKTRIDCVITKVTENAVIVDIRKVHAQALSKCPAAGSSRARHPDAERKRTGDNGPVS